MTRPLDRITSTEPLFNSMNMWIRRYPLLIALIEYIFDIRGARNTKKLSQRTPTK